MKKTNITRLSICMIATMVFGHGFSQSSDQVVAISVNSQVIPDTVSEEGYNTKPSAVVGVKVLRSFEQSFKGIQNPFWSAGNNKYVAQFKMGDRKAIALFGKNGYLIHTILYGKEKHLPSYEKSLVSEVYKDYTITDTQELTANDKKLWMVTLQNCSGIILLKILDGEMIVMEQYKKSN